MAQLVSLSLPAVPRPALLSPQLCLQLLDHVLTDALRHRGAALARPADAGDVAEHARMLRTLSDACAAAQPAPPAWTSDSVVTARVVLMLCALMPSGVGRLVWHGAAGVTPSVLLLSAVSKCWTVDDWPSHTAVMQHVCRASTTATSAAASLDAASRLLPASAPPSDALDLLSQFAASVSLHTVLRRGREPAFADDAARSTLACLHSTLARGSGADSVLAASVRPASLMWIVTMVTSDSAGGGVRGGGDAASAPVSVSTLAELVSVTRQLAAPGYRFELLPSQDAALVSSLRRGSGVDAVVAAVEKGIAERPLGDPGSGKLHREAVVDLLRAVSASYTAAATAAAADVSAPRLLDDAGVMLLLRRVVGAPASRQRRLARHALAALADVMAPVGAALEREASRCGVPTRQLLRALLLSSPSAGEAMTVLACDTKQLVPADAPPRWLLALLVLPSVVGGRSRRACVETLARALSSCAAEWPDGGAITRSLMPCVALWSCKRAAPSSTAAFDVRRWRACCAASLCISVHGDYPHVCPLRS